MRDDDGRLDLENLSDASSTSNGDAVAAKEEAQADLAAFDATMARIGAALARIEELDALDDERAKLN